MPGARAVVFAYSNVGARCLRVLRAHGVAIPLVVTHADPPDETLWFERVADVAADAGLAVTMPANPNVPDLIARVAALQPDFIFSFYYRLMLAPALLALAPRGAFNMHGSLLPKFRGRAPVNWAVLHGARETGATLHVMAAKPDAGDIVAQTAVPILPDDTAREVFDKVCVAAEMTLDRVLPAVLAGTAPRTPMDLAAGSYFGARRPEDGHIDWSQDAQQIHNLVRAVAPPYPGATTTIAGRPARVLKTRVVDAAGPPAEARLIVRDGAMFAHCGGGGVLRIATLELDGVPMAPAAAAHALGGDVHRLEVG
ncbi:MAG: formyltransferase [Casimicrobiaceae bacterium]